MAIHPIVQLGDPVLRMPALPVTRFDRALGRLLDDMTDTMRDAPGVGLAANQIGRRERVTVIEVDGRHYELVNPRLVETGGSQHDLEGCLSVAGYYAPLTRASRAVVVAQDRRGRSIRVSGEGLLARALQHETDHLDGRIYLDRLESLDGLIRPGEGRGRRGRDDDDDDDDDEDDDAGGDEVPPAE